MRKLTFLFGLFVLYSCSPVKIVSTEPSPGFALANYKTFDFLALDSSGPTSDRFNERAQLLKTEFAKQLALRGLQQDSTEPDLVINIGVVIEEKVQTRETDIRTDFHYVGQRNYSWKSGDVEVGRYKEGTVTLHLVDRKKNAMVWHGVVSGIISESDKQMRETITLGAQELVKKNKLG